MKTGDSSVEKSFRNRVVIPSGPAVLWMFSPASSFLTPLVTMSMFGKEVNVGNESS